MTDPGQTVPVPGPLGAGRWPVDQLAVSATGSDIAAVTDGGTVLRRAEVADGTVRTVLSGATAPAAARVHPVRRAVGGR